MSFLTLKRRSDFLRIRGGSRWSTPSLLLEGKMRTPASTASADAGRARGVDETAEIAAGEPARRQVRSDGHPARFGFTVTKKLGTAVVRNRIRRRLREIVREETGQQALPGCDYVIVAREAALRRSASALRTDLATAILHVNRKLANPAASRR